jgi:aspartate aminotransferase-like enzyme
MQNLRIPGPTPVPEKVLEAMAWQMVNHRGPEFGQMLQDVTEKMKQLFLTKNDLFLLSGSGTGGLEAAAVNILSPGDTVLSVSIGVFGDRWANIAKQFGAQIVPLQYEWGKAADPDEVRQALREHPEVKAVFITHNETSTGVTNPLKELSAVVKEFDKLLAVDCISSLGSLECPVDEWGLDVAVTGSQKGWMVPPGLTMLSVSEKAWQAHADARMPRFYWDFTKAKSYLDKNQTPWTPTMSIIYALTVALDTLLEEGVDGIVARHARMAQKTRDGIKALGLNLFADEKYASNTVTSVAASNGLDPKKLNKIMREEHGVVLGGGQQKLDGQIFRVGHLGFVTDADIDDVLAKLKIVLPQAGFKGA